MSKRKLVMEEHEGTVLVGVMQDGCDPILNNKQGSIEEVLAAVPDFLREAEEKWAVSSKNPAYKEPAAAKKATPPPAATSEQPKTAGDLPLLAATEKPTEVTTTTEEVPVAESVGGYISKEEAAKIAEDMGGSREDLETEVTAEAEITEPPAVPAEMAPEPVGEPVAPEVEPVAPEVTPAVQDIGERIAQTPAPPMAEPTKPGEWQYFLQDKRGPYGSVQEAMDALGLDKATRPTHNRWDRLSTALKEKILRRPKS